jgi:hypothetical protein
MTAIDARLLSASFVGLCLGIGALAAGEPSSTSAEQKRAAAQKAIIQLGDMIGEACAAQRAKQIVADHDSEDISSVFGNKPWGGLGVGKLAQNGLPRDSIERLINTLSRRKNITETEIEKYLDDYVRVAKVLQAMAELAPFRATENVKKSESLSKEWQEVARQFKEGALNFRKAVDGKDPKKLRLAAEKLQDTCCHCHGLAS